MRFQKWVELAGLEKFAVGLVCGLMVLVCIGGMLNFIVISANDWRMPVRSSYSESHGSPEIIDNRHITMTTQTRFKALADTILLPCVDWPSMVCYYSIGDMFLCAALALGIPSLPFLFFVRLREKGHGLTLLRFSNPPL